MPWRGKQFGRRRDLDESAEIHHRDPVRDVLYDRKVVRDEQQAQAEPGFQRLEQVENLRLHGHVERRDRFVANDKGRLCC